MEIIDELEPVTRGPYTGSLGYLGFNRESQFNIAIRTAIVREGQVHFQAGTSWRIRIRKWSMRKRGRRRVGLSMRFLSPQRHRVDRGKSIQFRCDSL